MPTLSGIAKSVSEIAEKVVTTGERAAEGMGSSAAGGAERAPRVNKSRMDHSQQILSSYNGGQNNTLRDVAYGTAAVGMGLGAYKESQDGNGAAATIFGAGALVMGGALALSHFNSVAEKGVEEFAAKGIANGPRVGETPGLGLHPQDRGAAESIIQEGKQSHSSGVTDSVTDRPNENVRDAKSSSSFVKDALNDHIANAKTALGGRFDKGKEILTGRSAQDIQSERDARAEVDEMFREHAKKYES